MKDLSNLKPPKGANRPRKRVGRGPGSGVGKTAGKGHKGMKARTGRMGKAGFEGGQMPLQRRLPKRGFTSPNREEYEIVNLRDLERVDAEEITPEVLDEHRLIDIGSGRRIKILGTGEVSRRITVRAHRVSESARAKIEAAGGSIELIES